MLSVRRLWLFKLRTCKLRKYYVTTITDVCPWKNVPIERVVSERQRWQKAEPKDRFKSYERESDRMDKIMKMSREMKEIKGRSRSIK